MSKLHLFGDSFTQGHKIDLTYENYKLWKEWRGGNLPKTWSELLSEKMEMECNVNAISGIGNDEIFQIICENCRSFQKNDIIIINWSFMNRFRWPNSDNEDFLRWVRMGIQKYNHLKNHISETTQMEIALKRSQHPLFAEEIYNYEKIIDTLCEHIGCYVYYWSMDNNVINSLPNFKLKQTKYICNEYVGNHILPNGEPNLGDYFTLFSEIYRRGGKNISQETNGLINDNHLGESGHKIQFEMFYEYLSNVQTINNKIV